jgi:hypothetical protein
MRMEISGEKWFGRRGIVIYGEKSGYATPCRNSITSAYVTNLGIKGFCVGIWTLFQITIT